MSNLARSKIVDISACYTSCSDNGRPCVLEASNPSSAIAQAVD